MQNRVNIHYEFAGIKFAVSAPAYGMDEHISKFRTESCKADLRYDVTFCDSIESPEGELLYSKMCREYYQKNDQRSWLMRHNKTKEIVMLDTVQSDNEHRVSFLEKYPEAWGENLMLKIMDLPGEILHYDGIFLHASFVVWNGEAILFCGRKQIGKSTQAGLWEKEKKAFIANGDRVALRKFHGIWYACGSPYCGTSKICENVKVPVRCIVILEQGKENEVCSVPPREAFVSLLKNCSYNTWDKDQMKKVLPITEKIGSEVEFVKLSCLPNVGAVEILEEYLCQNRK